MEGIGYNVLVLKDGMIELKGFVFGHQTSDGRVELFSDEVIDEIYCQYMGVDSPDEIGAYVYEITDDFAFHIGIPKIKDNDKPLWRDIMSSETLIITLLVDGKPQVYNEEGILVAINLVNKMKEGSVK